MVSRLVARCWCTRSARCLARTAYRSIGGTSRWWPTSSRSPDDTRRSIDARWARRRRRSSRCRTRRRWRSSATRHCARVPTRSAAPRRASSSAAASASALAFATCSLASTRAPNLFRINKKAFAILCKKLCHIVFIY
jgi:hypothetical protein